jgi:predicted metal-binding protein
MTEPTSQPVELLVCTTCRLGEAVPDAPRAGAVLYERLCATPPAGVTIRAVECLSNCNRGCTVALRGQGRWTYIYGALDPAQHLDPIVEGAQKYAATPDGLVPWRERPEHFRKNCIARIPPMEAQNVA